jgi:hypothetical protein
MKKNILYTTFTALICISLIISSQTYVSSNSSAPPSGKTGSPGDNGVTCTLCHGGTAQAQSNWIITTIPSAGYVAGTTYTITIAGQHNGVVKFGFEVTAEDNAGNKVGTLINTDATRTALVGTDFIGHTTVGLTPSTANANLWMFDWIAPASGTGDVTFYAALNASDGNGQTAGDVIYTSTATFSEDASTVSLSENDLNNINLYPNPVKDVLYVSGITSASTLSIYDIMGQLVAKSTELMITDNKINIQHLQAGTYFVAIETNNNRLTQKLIVF